MTLLLLLLYNIHYNIYKYILYYNNLNCHLKFLFKELNEYRFIALVNIIQAIKLR
jgi:hypothetical protein